MVTFCEKPITEGAMYKPLASVPTDGLSDQVTLVFVELVTVAMNCRVCEAERVAVEGLTVMLMPGGGGGTEEDEFSVTTPWGPGAMTWPEESRYKIWK